MPKNNVVLFAEVHYEEALDGVSFIYPEVEVDLVLDHSSLVVGSIGILGADRVSELL